MQCNLCKQESRAEPFGSPETTAEEMLKLQDQLARRQKEIELLHEQLNKLKTDLQVSDSDFNPIKNRIFRLYRTFLMERM
jgi:molecular chaperone GrpE (heat shock protein)